MITNDAGCMREIKSRISLAEAAFNKKKALFTSKLDLNLRKRLVKCFIRRTVLCGAGTGTLVNLYPKCEENFETWYWRRVDKISWIDRVKNKIVLQGVEDERNILHTMKRRRLTGLVTCCVGTAF